MENENVYWALVWFRKSKHENENSGEISEPFFCRLHVLKVSHCFGEGVQCSHHIISLETSSRRDRRRLHLRNTICSQKITKNVFLFISLHVLRKISTWTSHFRTPLYCTLLLSSTFLHFCIDKSNEKNPAIYFQFYAVLFHFELQYGSLGSGQDKYTSFIIQY